MSYQYNHKILNPYRFGFNGYEKDNEVKGAGRHLGFDDYGYDPATGRRWNIDPLSWKYSFQTPYAYAANNPIRYIDVNGENWIDNIFYNYLKKKQGLIVLFNESHVAAGSGFYKYKLWQKGRIYDKNGITYFTATGSANGFTKDGTTLNVGADVDFLDIGAMRHKTGKEGVDFLNARAPFAVDVMIADITFEDKMYGVSLGAGYGFGINKLSYSKYTAISMTKTEQEKIQGMSNWNNAVDISTLSIENQKDWTDEKGKIIGKRGELYITTQKYMSTKTEKKATGIFVNFMYQNTSDEKKNIIWKTDGYQCEQDWGGCSDGN
jgi:RHS repeat-associated protein